VKNVLITGGLGYLGGRITKYLSDKGYSVRIATRKTENNFPDNIPANTSVMQLDYYSADQCNKAMDGVNTLIHLAGADANTYLEDPENMIRHHGELMERLVCAAKYNNLEKFIYFSTIHVYGKSLHGTVTEKTKPIPVHPYAKAHLEAENILIRRLDNVAVCIIRCSNLFGLPFFANQKCWELVVNDLCKSAFQNNRLVINSSGQDQRDFISLGNAVDFTNQIIRTDKNGIYNLASSKTLKVIQFAKLIKKMIQDSFHIDCTINIKNESIDCSDRKNFTISNEKLISNGLILNPLDSELKNLLEYCHNIFSIYSDY